MIENPPLPAVFGTRPEEWELLCPLVGSSMLELGNKRSDQGTYKSVFTALGYRHVSVDLNGKDGALAMDLCKPLGLGEFDMVTNLGTSEHVEEQEPVWRNMVEATEHTLVCATPFPGDWTWHGYHHPTEAFYEALAEINGFAIERLYVTGDKPRRLIHARMIRSDWIRFMMPAPDLIHYNPSPFA